LACLYSEHLGQLDKAYELANKARGLLPDDPWTADTLGWIFFKKAQYDRALALLRESGEKLPAEPEIQFHLGMTDYMLGKQEPARLALQRAVETGRDFPDKQDAQRRLALLNLDTRVANATDLADLEERLREEPNDPVALGRLAAIQECDQADGEQAQRATGVRHSPPDLPTEAATADPEFSDCETCRIRAGSGDTGEVGAARDAFIKANTSRTIITIYECSNIAFSIRYPLFRISLGLQERAAETLPQSGQNVEFYQVQSASRPSLRPTFFPSS
jgi:hypothetical protein